MGRRADRALALDPQDPAVLYTVTCACAQLGLPDLALDRLERGTLNGAGHRAWIENDSYPNSLRDNPRFQAILDRIQEVYPRASVHSRDLPKPRPGATLTGLCSTSCPRN